MKLKQTRLAILVVALVATLAVSVLAPRVIEAGPKLEYKFVRLVDEGAMPTISAALNREADRGWRLEEMSVVAGNPSVIYLVLSR